MGQLVATAVQPHHGVSPPRASILFPSQQSQQPLGAEAIVRIFRVNAREVVERRDAQPAVVHHQRPSQDSKRRARLGLRYL
jgi:hypothetical protein